MSVAKQHPCSHLCRQRAGHRPHYALVLNIELLQTVQVLVSEFILLFLFLLTVFFVIVIIFFFVAGLTALFFLMVDVKDLLKKVWVDVAGLITGQTVIGIRVLDLVLNKLHDDVQVLLVVVFFGKHLVAAKLALFVRLRIAGTTTCRLR